MTTPNQLNNIPHTIRFPGQIYRFIKELAHRERRTFNSQVIFLIVAGIRAVYDNTFEG